MNILDLAHPKGNALDGLIALCSHVVNGDRLMTETRKRLDAHRRSFEETIETSAERKRLDNLTTQEESIGRQILEKKSALERDEAALSKALGESNEIAIGAARASLWKNEAELRALEREAPLIRALVNEAEKKMAAFFDRTETLTREQFVRDLAAERDERAVKLIELFTRPDAAVLLSELAVAKHAADQVSAVTRSMPFELKRFQPAAKPVAPPEERPVIVSSMPSGGLGAMPVG
jgi:hypothetical protein